jgi:hypothetical protein
MQALMFVVCALVLLHILFFLALLTGELTRWLILTFSETYRNRRQQVMAALATLTLRP